MSGEKFNVNTAVAAGAAGGAAEVLWVAIAVLWLGVDGSAVARGVTATLASGLSASRFAPALGLIIHFALSIVLAAAFVQTLGRRLHGTALVAASLLLLAAVWAFNFLVLLPLINPAFVSLLPLPVTLVSKLLFGVSMAAVLVRRQGRA